MFHSLQGSLVSAILLNPKPCIPEAWVFARNKALQFRVYLEGLGDLVGRLTTPTTHIVTLVILIINQLINSPNYEVPMTFPSMV